MQMLVSLTETSSPAKWSMLRFSFCCLRPCSRTSFHHQPEAQHPNSSSTSWQADYPIFRGQSEKLSLAVDPQPDDSKSSLLEREDCTLVTWYRSLYAPRAGGAYDSHHRTAGIAGCNQRRGCRVAARGGRAAAVDAGDRISRLWLARTGRRDSHFCQILATWRAYHLFARISRIPQGLSRIPQGLSRSWLRRGSKRHV